MRTHYFVSNSALLLGVLVLLGIIVARNAKQMPPLCLFVLGGVAFGLLSFWFAIFKVHTEIHGLISTAGSGSSQFGPVADRALATVAALNFQSLLAISGMVGLCLMALAEILRSH